MREVREGLWTWWERWERLLEQHIRTNSELMTREPAGQLAHPYTVPSAPGAAHYATALWDWDSWSASIVLGQVAIVAAIDLGCAQQLLAAMGAPAGWTLPVFLVIVASHGVVNVVSVRVVA